jgi:addiction module HigA family antidote
MQIKGELHMKLLPQEPAHPGAYVRQSVIPGDMSVTDVAKLIGVGRPALSNFLNGKSSLSLDMAARLEKTFKADRKHLLEMQANYDQYVQGPSEKELVVRAFVPNFLTIKASQIEGWSSKIEARTLLPVLLRKLVHSTGIGLSKVDFPGYDNAERHGSDGFISADTAIPWIPEGDSYWEFGTNKDPNDKANDDYNASLKKITLTERKNSTFVFVTPRNWNGKTAWEKQKNESGDWKAVRSFDASDLEQWLEQSVPAQIWFAEQLTLPTSGYETLEQAWNRWANASDPHLTSDIFAPSLTSHRDAFKAWLSQPSDRPFVLNADSNDEALAFLACMFNDETLRHFEALTAVFTSAETLKTLISSSVPFVPIVYLENVERELSDAYHRLHCIILRPRNAVDRRVDIALDLLGAEDFEKALIAMGVKEDDIERLARESGHSPTILRRRLSRNDAIQKPKWASDDQTAKVLVPITLIGTWHVELKADHKIVACVADKKYEAIEDDIARLLLFDDCPVWSVGRYRGVASKIDALFAVARLITSEDIERFFDAAECVLSEIDPALELPDEKRWAAALYDKNRDYSNALREGICETLVLLSLHGNNLLQGRLGVDVESKIVLLIRKLLTPLTLEKLLSQDHNLPRYAEAAPDEFLRIIEEDLGGNAPVLLGLLKPVDSSGFGASPSRTGLLWALECLAWKPQNLSRVSKILAQLSQYKIDDNWGNKPDASLSAIFRSWMPQTAASLEQRIKVLGMLARHFPDIIWGICIEQLSQGSRMGHYSYRPHWRSDASGFGHVVSPKERYEFTRKTLDLLIAWPSHNEKTLGDLVESLRGIPEEDQTTIWKMINEWSQEADEAAKAVLRERIRRFAFTPRSRRREIGKANRDQARLTYDNLRPHNPVIRHTWLFADEWIQESADEIEEEDFDYRKSEERIAQLRKDAMLEIWEECGFDGVSKLLIESKAAGTIGRYVAFCITDVKAQVNFVVHCLSLEGNLQSNAEWCLRGFLWEVEEDLRSQLVQSLIERLDNEGRRRLFVCAPFRTSTWRLLENYGDDLRVGYWKSVNPSWLRESPAELNEVVDSLLEVRRPRAAFYAVHMNFDGVETSRLKRLLHDVATVNAESEDHYKIDSYNVSEALHSLDSRVGVTRDEMAQFEFLFINALHYTEHGIPNLENQIVQSPMLFVQVLALVYKRSDEVEDMLESLINNPEQRANVASAAYRLLGQIKKIPGTDDSGRVDVAALTTWLVEVRRLCREHGRTVIGDQQIGQLLANAPSDENGMWPCESVCEAMEEIGSPEIGRGFHIGVYNSRGAFWGRDAGKQEQELAAKYRACAERLHFDYPYMGSVLEGIAKNYDSLSQWQESEEKIVKRLRH